MCKDATIIPRSKPVEISSEDQSKILCDVIVRATHDLHLIQKKNQNEIEVFLKKDCRKLTNLHLVEKVKKKSKWKSFFFFNILFY